MAATSAAMMVLPPGRLSTSTGCFQLSERRALAVADNLTNRGGVLRDRLYVAGRGSSQPIATNDTEAGRAKNRRVEIILRPYTG